MVSFTKLPDIHRGELAQQSLLLRLILVPLFAIVSLWVAQTRTPIILALVLYILSSAILAAGYRKRILGSTDVIYFGMVDTALFLGAGTYFTDGAFSPVLFLFFGLQASYLILSTPRVFVAAAALSGLVMAVSVALVEAGVTPEGFTPPSPGENAPAYLIAAVGALAMLGGVGWFHSLVYVGRSQAHHQLEAAMSAAKVMSGLGLDGDIPLREQLSLLLNRLMDALRITDEGSIYLYAPEKGSLYHEISLGLNPWFQAFPEFQPGEGNIGLAFQRKETTVSRYGNELSRHLEGLSQANLEVLARTLAQANTPSYSLAVPLRWRNEVLGVMALSRQTGGRGLDAEEITLAEAFAQYMALLVVQSRLIQQIKEVEQETNFHRRFRSVLATHNPQAGMEELARQLRELVPFDCVRMIVATATGMEPISGHFWCPGSLDLNRDSVDLYLRDMFQSPAAVPPAQLSPEGPLAGSWAEWPVPPDLANRGVGSTVGYKLSANGAGQPQLLGVMVLLHRESGFYTHQHLQILQSLDQYLVPLMASAALYSNLAKKTRDREWLSRITSLVSATGDPDELIRTLMKWAAESTGGAEAAGPVTTFVVVADPDKGTLNVTVYTPDGRDPFKRQVIGATSEEANRLFQQLDQSLSGLPLLGGNMEGSSPASSRNGEVAHSSDSPMARQIKGLVGITEDSKIVSFPLHAGGKTHGILGIKLPANYAVGEALKTDIQQFAGIAALCLQNSGLYEAQAKHARELQHEDELRKSFISFIIHELRTPLTSLKAAFELIWESDEIRGLNEPYQRLLSNINRSVATLERLIQDLSEVTNLATGSVLLNKQRTSPEAIVYPVIEMTAPLSHLKNQSLEVELPPDLPTFTVDAGRLEQVLTNLLSNAIKYTPRGGTIRLSVAEDDGVIKFAVSDNGAGIAPEYLEQVFEPFFRMPPGTTERSPGSGLGLALAKSLVELHRGKIWVESETGRGSTFYFTIPRD